MRLLNSTILAATAAVAALGVTASSTARADEPIRVVATFSILGDMVRQIGGDHVHVVTLVGPDGDAHVFQPTPADARAVSEAHLLIVNGLEFEGWLERLIDASDFRGAEVVASHGIRPLLAGESPDHMDEHADDHAHAEEHDHEMEHEEEHAHADEHDHEMEHEEGHAHADEHHHDDADDPAHGGDVAHAEEHGEMDGHGHDDEPHSDEALAEHGHGIYDPHAWQSLDNAKIYVANIAAALAVPGHAGEYEANRARYAAEIDALDEEIRGLIATLPDDHRTIVTSHDAFAYFGHEYGLTFVSPQGISTDAEPSAKGVSQLIDQIREENITAVFLESASDPRLLERIAAETGAAIGGTLYPGALSESDGPAPTYLDMMRHNATSIVSVLKP